MLKSDPELLNALAQGDVKPTSSHANTLSLRSGTVIKRPLTHSTMAEKTPPAESSANHLVVVHEDPRQPKYTGETGGMDVYTFLSLADETIAKRKITDEKEKIDVLRNLVDPNPCEARSFIMGDFIKKAQSYEEVRNLCINIFSNQSKLGAVSSLFKLADAARNRRKPSQTHDAVRLASNVMNDCLLQFEPSPWNKGGSVPLPDVIKLFGYIRFLIEVPDDVYKRLKETDGLTPDKTITEYAAPFWSQSGSSSPAASVSALSATRAGTRRASPVRKHPSSKRRDGRSSSRGPGRSSSRSPSRSPERGADKRTCIRCRRRGHTSATCRAKYPARQYCKYHKTNTHSTEDCRVLKVLNQSGNDNSDSTPDPS